MNDTEDAKPTGKKSEIELLRDAQNGDDVAFGCLLMLHFEELAQRVDREIPRKLRGILSAEEVLQEAFGHAFRDRQKINSWTAASFRAWLRGVVDHRLLDTLDKLKAQKRGGQFERLEQNPPTSSDSVYQLVDLVTADSVTASRIATRREAVAALHIAVEQLSADQQQAIRHRYLEGKSVAETARSMDRTEGAVRGYLRRAIAGLRQHMKKYERWRCPEMELH